MNPTKAFRQKIIDGLLDGYSKRTLKKGRRSHKSYPLSKNFPDGQHYMRQHEKGHKPNCVVCSVMPSQCKKKGKGECKRKQTT